MTLACSRHEDTLILPDQGLSTMCLALLTLWSCFEKFWLTEPLCYSTLFSDDVANDEGSELQGALTSTIFCKVGLRENICFMFYRHHCAM